MVSGVLILLIVAAVIFFVILSGVLAAQLLPQWVARQFTGGRKPHDI